MPSCLMPLGCFWWSLAGAWVYLKGSWVSLEGASVSPSRRFLGATRLLGGSCLVPLALKDDLDSWVSQGGAWVSL